MSPVSPPPPLFAPSAGGGVRSLLAAFIISSIVDGRSWFHTPDWHRRRTERGTGGVFAVAGRPSIASRTGEWSVKS